MGQKMGNNREINSRILWSISTKYLAIHKGPILTISITIESEKILYLEHLSSSIITAIFYGAKLATVISKFEN